MADSFALKIFTDGKAGKVPVNTAPDEETNYIWHHIFSPAEDDLKKLPESYGLHPLAIEDCLDDDQIPKMESFQNNTHLIFNTFSYQNDDVKAEEVNIFIGEKFLITVSRSQKMNNAAQSLAEKILSSAGTLSNGPSWLLHLITDKIIDEKMNILDVLEDETESIEDELLENNSDIDFVQIQRLRHTFQQLRKSLFHEREILYRIIREEHDFISHKSSYLFRDVYDHVVRLYEMTESCRENVKNLVELHLAIANNQMALAADNTNKTIRRLTFITTVFMPMTLIAGIGGMSEYTSVTGTENWEIAYGLLMLFFLILGVLSYRWLQGIDRKS
ncbi:Cobalt/magnesium transport protein CorA [bioreactor metagenome]|uniref:Cobalt/magnesium transport protein CorA n=1 Tax=bioreactor metagenome TaxID=1076179 RepID=A0A644X3P5_9ZZZZ